jgi:signal transduction histidine kinase
MRWPTRDIVTAASLAVVLVAGTLLVVWLVQTRQPVPPPLSAGSVVLVCVLNIAGCATIAVRRVWPVVALAVGTGLVLTCAAVELAAIGPGLGLVVSGYTLASRLPGRRAVPILAAAAVTHGVGGILISRWGGDVDGLPTFWGVPGQDLDAMVTATVATYAIPGLIGALVRRRRAHTAALAGRVERLEAERVERDRVAAAQERGRIARELHDIAAHDLSAIVVQAGAADRLVDGDPAAAKEVLRNIRGQGRDTLASLRELVGIMRDEDGGGRAPQPGLTRVDDLFAVARGTGMTLSTSVEGEPVPLARPADLAAYRIVQEALTNARRHAPGAPVTLRIIHDRGVRLEIRNGPTAPHRTAGPPPSGQGHGLAGMRERIRHVGGTLTVGPTGDGGWAVVATLPAAS